VNDRRLGMSSTSTLIYPDILLSMRRQSESLMETLTHSTQDSHRHSRVIGYQYMSLNHMGPSSSHLPSPYAARSPIDGMSAAAQQQGVWMPLQQAANGPYSSGISNTGSPIYGMHNMSKSPGKCKTRQRKAKSSS
jgi:hypothetical protein